MQRAFTINIPRNISNLGKDAVESIINVGLEDSVTYEYIDSLLTTMYPPKAKRALMKTILSDDCVALDKELKAPREVIQSGAHYRLKTMANLTMSHVTLL